MRKYNLKILTISGFGFGSLGVLNLIYAKNNLSQITFNSLLIVLLLMLGIFGGMFLYYGIFGGDLNVTEQ